MNFVNGKNYEVPKEKVCFTREFYDFCTYFCMLQATKKEAKSVCEKKGMGLLSIETLAEMSSVQSFLGNMGLSSETLMTSMMKVTDGTGDWLGDIGASLMAANPSDTATNGDCLGLGSLGLVGVTCDMVSNFVCEAPTDDANTPAVIAYVYILLIIFNVNKQGKIYVETRSRPFLCLKMVLPFSLLL